MQFMVSLCRQKIVSYLSFMILAIFVHDENQKNMLLWQHNNPGRIRIFVRGFSIKKTTSTKIDTSYLSSRFIKRSSYENCKKSMTSIRYNSRLGSSSCRTIRRTSDCTLQMCICIHCARVTNCSAYHFVETKHEQPHIAANPTFTPRDGSPTIHVNVRSIRTDDTTNEMKRMWREHTEETVRAQEKSTEEEVDNEGRNQQQQQSLHGETKYNITPITTYEYDVVACADFKEDKNCWVRNMPDEIKRANPNFVPT